MQGNTNIFTPKLDAELSLSPLGSSQNFPSVHKALLTMLQQLAGTGTSA